MANIDNELDDLYAQLSSLSRSGREDSSSSTASSTKSSSVKSRPSSSSGNYSRFLILPYQENPFLKLRPLELVLL